MVYFTIFLFGAIIGSFLNVCIYRLPLDKSVVTPRSYCSRCSRNLPWYENIPIFSWMVLRAKCRGCGEKISWQYPLIEILSGVVGVLLVQKFGLNWHTLVMFVFAASMIVVGVIDLHHRIIPDEISLSGIVLGFAYAFVNPEVRVVQSLLGILIGGGFLYLIAIAYETLRKEEGMGMGDVKLLAMIGAFLGWKSLLFVVLVGSLSGSLIGILFILSTSKGLKYQIPFGTFLAFAAITQVLYGQKIESFWGDMILKLVAL